VPVGGRGRVAVVAAVAGLAELAFHLTTLGGRARLRRVVMWGWCQVERVALGHDGNPSTDPLLRRDRSHVHRSDPERDGPPEEGSTATGRPCPLSRPAMSHKVRRIVPAGETIADAVRLADAGGWPLVLALGEPMLLGQQGEVIGTVAPGLVNVRFSVKQVRRMVGELCRSV
jgi:hypothetical protein